jgi:Bacterial lipoate protein ligase C-terminus
MQMSNLYKASKGLIRVEANVENNIILDIRLTGDFFMIPENTLWLLEKHLKGIELDRKLVKGAVNVFYLLGVQTPMLTKDDLVNAIVGVKNENAAY